MLFQTKKMLNVDCVLIDVEAKSDTEIISILVEKLISRGLVKDSFKNAVLEREKTFPTGLPTMGIGIAIPHADSKYVNEPSFAIAKLKNPVSFSKMGGEPDEKVDVSLVILMGVREDKAQVKTIVKIIKMFSDEMIVNKIKKSKTNRELYEIFYETIKIQKI